MHFGIWNTDGEMVATAQNHTIAIRVAESKVVDQHRNNLGIPVTCGIFEGNASYVAFMPSCEDDLTDKIGPGLFEFRIAPLPLE